MSTRTRGAVSKRKILPILLDAAPDRFDRYVEPFAGSACLFFALGPSHAVLADINTDLVNVYRALKTDVESVIGHLSLFKRNKSEYYRVRSQSIVGMPKERRAARFIGGRWQGSGTTVLEARGALRTKNADHPDIVCEVDAIFQGAILDLAVGVVEANLPRTGST